MYLFYLVTRFTNGVIVAELFITISRDLTYVCTFCISPNFEYINFALFPETSLPIPGFGGSFAFALKQKAKENFRVTAFLFFYIVKNFSAN